MTTKKPAKIALVLKGYPRLSETFIAQEILELERAGFEIELVSLRHPTDKKTHPIHDEISAPKRYLPEYIYQELWRVTRAKLACLLMPGFWRAVPVFLKDLWRDPTPNRIRRFGQALVLAREYAPHVDMLYVHFLHTPGSVARYASIITGKPFAISAHAKDIWTIPEWEIREKLADCEWLVTCTQGGADYLKSLSENKVHLVYHGLDLTRFPPFARKHSARDGASSNTCVQLVTVGRAVSKKGLDTLIDALAALPKDLHWHWTHIGGGPLRDALVEQAKTRGVAARCDFKGALPQIEVLETYKKSDLFILPSRIDETGDRDGLPNVIVEAQSQQLPVISTNISGIPELIETGKNGVLIEPDDVSALGNVIEKLCRDPDLRTKMGKAGDQKVRSQFSHKQTIDALIALIGATLQKVGKAR